MVTGDGKATDYILEFGNIIMFFERICEEIRYRIKEILYNDQLPLHASYCDILLEGLDPHSLFKKYMSLYIAKYPNNKEELKILKEVKKKFNDLVNLRNNFIHGVSKFGFKPFETGHAVHSFEICDIKVSINGLKRNVKVFNRHNLMVITSGIQRFYLLCTILKYLNPEFEPPLKGHPTPIEMINNNLEVIEFNI